MPNTNRNSAGRGNWIVRTVITAACVLGFGLAVYLAIRVFGRVEGVEFSPDTFATQEFVYWEIPLIRTRVTPVYKTDTSGALQMRLQTPGDLTPAQTEDPPRWHLVAMNKAGAKVYDNALIVYRYLHEDAGVFVLFSRRKMPRCAGTSGRTTIRSWRSCSGRRSPKSVAAICTRSPRHCSTRPSRRRCPRERRTAPDEFQEILALELAEQYTALGDVRASSSCMRRRSISTRRRWTTSSIIAPRWKVASGRTTPPAIARIRRRTASLKTLEKPNP